MSDDTPLVGALRVVASLVRRRRAAFAASVLGSITFAGATVGATIALGRVVDDVVLPELADGTDVDARTIWGGVGLVVLVAVLRAVGVVARRYFAGMTAAGVKREYRDDLAEAYLTLPASWIRARPAGRLLAHTDADTERLVDALHPLPFSLGTAFLAVFAAISAVAVDPILAVVGFVVFPVTIGLNRVYSRLVEGPATRSQQAAGEVAAVANDSFDGALIVKTLGLARHESDRFDGAVADLRRHRIALGVVRSAFHATVENLPHLGIVVVTVVGVYRLDAGALTTGQLVQLVALFSVLAFPMQVFAYFLESLPPTVVSHQRIHGVVDLPIAPDPSTPAAHVSGAARVEVDDLAYEHDDGAAALRDVTLHVAPRDTVAIVGSTGSGKSTLARLIGGVTAPTSGSVSLDGVDLTRLHPDDRIDRVAFVFQEPFLVGESVRDNIDLAGTADLGDVRAAAAAAHIDEFVTSLPQGYGTVIGERGVTLSGGQRQRIALARALLGSPGLVVLDDATSAVDAHTEQEILEGLRAVDATKVIVAQRLSTIELADRVVFVRDGTVRREGTHEELMGDPDYVALVTAYEAATT